MIDKIPADPSSPNFEPLSCHVPLLLAISEESSFLDTPCPSLLLTFAHTRLYFDVPSHHSGEILPILQGLAQN